MSKSSRLISPGGIILAPGLASDGGQNEGLCCGCWLAYAAAVAAAAHAAYSWCAWVVPGFAGWEKIINDNLLFRKQFTKYLQNLNELDEEEVLLDSEPMPLLQQQLIDSYEQIRQQLFRQPYFLIFCWLKILKEQFHWYRHLNEREKNRSFKYMWKLS